MARKGRAAKLGQCNHDPDATRREKLAADGHKVIPKGGGGLGGKVPGTNRPKPPGAF